MDLITAQLLARILSDSLDLSVPAAHDDSRLAAVRFIADGVADLAAADPGFDRDAFLGSIFTG